MDCPTLDTLGLALDLDPEDPDHLAVTRHMVLCTDCEDKATFLRDVEAALGYPRTWGEAESTARRCLDSSDLLIALSGQPDAYADHFTSCQPCRTEFEALRDVEAEPVSSSLRTRLRRLSAQDASTAETTRGRKRSARRSSGSGLGSSRRTTSRRRVGSGRGRRPIRSVPKRTQQPVWAWGVLAAAAAILVSMAIALSPSESGSGRLATATWGPDEGEPSTRVSDVQGQERPTPRPTQPPTIEPSYPLPSVPTASDEADTWRPGVPTESPNEDTPDDAADDTIEHVPSDPKPVHSQVKAPAPDAGGDSGKTEAPESVEQAREPAATPMARVADDGGRIELAFATLSGSVILERDGEKKKLSRGKAGVVELRPGDRLRTSTGGFVSLDGGAYELCLDKDTDVQIRGAISGPVLGLERGRVLAEVASLVPGRRFQVLTSQGEFSVLGTVFGVETGTDRARVLVAEGTVEAKTSEAAVKVPAGKAVELKAGAAPGLATRVRGDELAWAQPWAPRRKTLYAVHFDDSKLGGFGGALASNLPLDLKGQALLLSALPENRFWGQAAMVARGRMPSFRADADAYVQFSVYSEEPVQVLFQAFNDSQGKEFKRGYDHPGGYWRTFTVPLLQLSTYYDPAKNPVRAGDLFVDLEIYAAKPGDTSRILVDDVTIYRRHYR